MPRVKVGVTAHRRHKKILKLAKGYKGSKSKQFKKANETVMKALYYARRDRRAKKGNFRRLWIARINAAARTNGISYRRRAPGGDGGGVRLGTALWPLHGGAIGKGARPPTAGRPPGALSAL